jgi:hypothetical protein
MIVLIVLGAFAVVMLVYAFWPRRRGVVDGDIRRQRGDVAARDDYLNGPRDIGPGSFGGGSPS